jgi:hypothetical protein
LKRFNMEKNMEPPMDWDTPGKLPKLPKNRALPHGINPAFLAPTSGRGMQSYMGMPGRNSLPNAKGNLPPLLQAPKNKPIPGLIRTNNPRALQAPMMNPHMQRGKNEPMYTHTVSRPFNCHRLAVLELQKEHK